MTEKRREKRGGRSSESLSVVGENGHESDHERLEYVCQILMELRQIAEKTGEGTLVYMIEMAAMEAEECQRLRRLTSKLTG